MLREGTEMQLPMEHGCLLELRRMGGSTWAVPGMLRGMA